MKDEKCFVCFVVACHFWAQIYLEIKKQSSGLSWPSASPEVLCLAAVDISAPWKTFFQINQLFSIIVYSGVGKRMVKRALGIKKGDYSSILPWWNARIYLSSKNSGLQIARGNRTGKMHTHMRQISWECILLPLLSHAEIGLLQQTITWYMVVGKLIIIPALGH